MKITHLKVNHLENPLGNALLNPTISYVVEDTEALYQKRARVEVAKDEAFSSLVYDSGIREDICSAAFALPFSPEPCTRYFWRVTVTADNGDTAANAAWFETPKQDEWHADWITPECSKEKQVVLCKRIHTQDVERARMYMVGLGVYELYLNGDKVSDECLLPGFCAYDSWIPFQTFEMELREGENLLEIMLGDGWYKGNFGLSKKYENYGDGLAAIGELHIWHKDGTKEVVCTDTSWTARPSAVVWSGIYSGECLDMTVDTSEEIGVKVIDLDKGKLRPRLNPRLRVQHEIKPIAVIRTPKGETVLDMGQNMVGWLRMHCKAPAGTKIHLQFGEILQDGNFYRENLRTAKAEFYYVSNGEECDVRQHFTFYGFRYVKVSGCVVMDGDESGAAVAKEALRLDDFTGLVIYSDLEDTGFIETSDPLVSKLFLNIKWGQRGNFLDVPTDCPQRDERYGWTGDAQVFSGTACLNTDAYAFYVKYGYDVFCEQKKLDGAVPDTVPIANFQSTISTAWGEAATIIPWNVFLTYGDPGILLCQYDSMRAWVDYMKREDDKYGSKRLWQTGFHYGDWLALDGPVKGGVFGRTDPHLIASAYYYFSTNIVAQTADVLGREEDRIFYGTLADEIREAFFREYYSPNGRLCVDTMTAYTLVLYTGLVPEGALASVCEGLMQTLRKSRYHLQTGFVGTPYLCRVLSENGMNDLAYHLLLEKGYPGWLYEVLMGATTVWERWNSVLPDGKISGIEMNSLNHYAYGSIAEWMYRNMLGIRPLAELCGKQVNGNASGNRARLLQSAGYRRFCLAPQPNWRLAWAKGDFRSPYGNIHSEWEIAGEKLIFKVTVPFGSECELFLPDAEISGVLLEMPLSGEEKSLKLSEVQVCEKASRQIAGAEQMGTQVKVSLRAGSYTFAYVPTVPYRKGYSLDSSLKELLEYGPAKAILDEEFFSVHDNMPFFEELYTLRETLNSPFMNLPYEVQKRLDKRLRELE